MHNSPTQQLEFAGLLTRFHSTVDAYAAKVAISHNGQEWTYAELDELASRFAFALDRDGVAAGDCIGLCMDHSIDAIASMLACFKLRAAFVPLDPEYPLERLLFMLEDAGISTVATNDLKSNHQLQAILEATSNAVKVVDSSTENFDDLPLLAEGDEVAADDVAYIMYTSGSTGNPKGVVIEHMALEAYCLADAEIYQLDDSDRTLQFSTLNFDIAIEEIFPPLITGGAVVIRPSLRSDAANELSAIIEEHNVTAVHLATAYWHEWVDLMRATEDSVPSCLRLAIATGEKVSVEHYRRWLELCARPVLWCNAYGPTEATVTATVFIPDVDFDAAHMPIGKPLPGYTAWILDDQLQPIPVPASQSEISGTAEQETTSATGQLFIGGPALAREYLNRPDLTSSAFIDVELPSEDGLPSKERLYRTGDLARWLPSGDIDFGGRVDHQIKLGSYRIEPGEIEAVLHQHPGVRESLVTYERVGNQKFLIAYVSISNQDVTIESVHEFARKKLPGYMVPPRYVLLDQMPKTINGKIDRDSLPNPSLSESPYEQGYVAPRTELEMSLAELWQDVLQVPRIGIYDDFFALGGSSLLVTRVIAGLKKDYDVELPVRDFFANATVASSARHIAGLLDLPVEEPADSEKLILVRSRPSIEPGYLHRDGNSLFNVVYRCRTESAARQHGILICQPLGHEYARAYRNIQQLAVQLCQAGHPVMRFDYSGTGNSSGGCEDFNAESLLADTAFVATHMRETLGIERLSIVGLRIGATIASQLDNYDELIAWDPVIRGSSFLAMLREFHDNTLNSQTRFSRKMIGLSDQQLYGHRMSTEQVCSLSELSFSTDPRVGMHQQTLHLVLSEGYAESEPELAFTLQQDGVTSVQTTDQILWQQPDFAEQAFSSPEAFETIKQILKD